MSSIERSRAKFVHSFLIGRDRRHASHRFWELHPRGGDLFLSNQLNDIIRTVETKHLHGAVFAGRDQRLIRAHRHRIVAAGKDEPFGIGGYGPSGLRLKRRLLALEGTLL